MGCEDEGSLESFIGRGTLVSFWGLEKHFASSVSCQTFQQSQTEDDQGEC